MTDITRPLLAAMISDELRVAFAEILLDGVSITDAQRERARNRLMKTGLVTEEDGRAKFDPQRAIEALKAMAKPRAEGAEQYLTGNGRIDRYPSDHNTRVSFLQEIAARLLKVEVTYAEKEITEVLATMADDPVLLRRYFVDYGVVTRTQDGAMYMLTARP